MATMLYLSRYMRYHMYVIVTYHYLGGNTK